MSSTFQSIVDVDATADEADELADEVLTWLVGAGAVPSACRVARNESAGEGLEIWTRRTVFPSMTGENRVSCPRCGYTADQVADPGGAWQDLSETIGEWYDGGPGVQACWACRGRVGLNGWIWSPPWGFGQLGFTFWGWPPFSRQFLAAVADRLGHRTVHPYGCL